MLSTFERERERMGGCATKPKVSIQGDEGDAPAPVVVKEEDVVSYAKEEEEEEDVIKIVDQQKHVNIDDDEDKDKEILHHHDDQGINPRSLSNLFKENEEKKDPSENDKKPSEQIKREDLLEIGKATVPSEEQPREVEKAEALVFYDAVKAETEKPIEATQTTEPETPEEKKPTTETQTTETLEEKKTVEDEKSVAETQKFETPEEKKTSEEKLVTETLTPDTSEKKTDVSENV